MRPMAITMDKMMSVNVAKSNMIGDSYKRLSII
jgi:hypothetical protein